MTDLHYLSATQALSLFKSKQLSPVELMQAVIDRAEKVEPHINAFSSTYYEEALIEAKAAEYKYTHNKEVGALEGLPLAVKDEADVKGKRTTQCSLVFKDNISDKNSITIERLLNAGAIVHARSACPEFCTLLATHSRLNGITRNPWNLQITPGGSSGGAGASLAAGSTTLATGSDIGGSIRYPASMCGIVGFKAPYGRIPEDGYPFNLDTYNHQGPMARTVNDTALMGNVMAGPHPLDIATVKPKYELPLEFNTDLRGFKIAYSTNLGYMAVEQDVIDNLLEAVALFKSLGASVEEVNVPWDNSVDRAAQAHYRHIFGVSMEYFLKKYRDLLCDYNIDYTEESLKAARDPLGIFKALLKETEMYSYFGPMMENYDVFICPTVTSTQLPANGGTLKDKFAVNGVVLEDDMGMSFCHQFNMLSRCPVLVVPAGFTKNNVPSGIQIVGKTFDDITVFRAGAALEKASGLLNKKPFIS
jgi:amidase